MTPPHIWTPDVLPGFEQTTLTGLTAPDGPVEVVMVRRRCNLPGSRAVLYIHGYVDYFFQTHLADFYNEAKLHFYALDLRRHGRSLRAHQHPCYTSDLDEYLEDVDAAITCLLAQENVNWLLLNGHSTGGLVAALYAHRGIKRSAVNAVFLNSPFLDMNFPAWKAWVIEPIVAAWGAFFPRSRLPVNSVAYGQSLHVDHHGEWHYDTHWKPVGGFGTLAGWFRAIHRAHAEVSNGLSIACPVLVMHAGRSLRTRQWCEAAMTADIVLNVADIKRLAPKLGDHVEVQSIADGIHDLILSQLATRNRVFKALRGWLVSVGGIQTRN